MSLPLKTPAQPRTDEKRSFGQGVFSKCQDCGALLTREQLSRYFEVCPSCGHHHPLAVREWRRLLLDGANLDVWDEHVRPMDPLKFEDGIRYETRLGRAMEKTGCSEAIETGRAAIGRTKVAYGCFNFGFMGGSMGSVVGERLTRLFERATGESLPVVLLHASGGARMQEGILSLMQMAKSVSALARFRQVRKPYISVLLNPTTGGVAASTALLGDVNVVERGALIGFAGQRVIENTINTRLPEGFQRPDFLMDHGMIDIIAARAEMRDLLSTLLRHLSGGHQ